MPGFRFQGLLFLLLCMHWTTAQWFTFVLNKGRTCEDHCKTKVKKCNQMDEYRNCKCFPKLLVDNWLQYNSLPIDPNVVCRMSWTGVVPKCCDFYRKQKDAYMNSQSNHAEQLKKKLASQEEEMKELEKKCGKDESVLPSNLTADMLSLLVEKSRQQNDEIEKLSRMLTDQKQELQNLTQVWSSEPWKPYAKQLIDFAAASTWSSSIGIGFTAYIGNNMVVGKNKRVVFDKIYINEGNGYNPATGIFTCPVAGAYVFSFNIAAKVKLVNFELRLNDHLVVSMYVDPIHTAHNEANGGTTALARLRQGDRVSVYQVRANTVFLHSSEYFRFNHFTGFRVY